MLWVREFAGVAAVAFAAMGAVAALSQHSVHQSGEVVALRTFVLRPAMGIARMVAPGPKSLVADAPAITFAAPVTTVPTSPAGQGSLVAALDAQAKQTPVILAQPSTMAKSAPTVTATVVPPVKTDLRLAASDSRPLVSNDTADLANAVALRLRDSVPSELFPYFDVYLYVSKAASGPWAQHMFIFHKGDDGHLVFEQSVPVSTGRERQEKYFTATPTGLFELDPNRFDRDHRSHRWHNAPMPWAMFLNYTIHNHLAGVALHSGIGHVALLGQRASGGCVRLPPETAEMLFKRFQAEEAGEVPLFAFNETHSTTLTDGTLALDADGRPLMAHGYKVLLIIQDYPGGPALVAEVS